MGAGASADAEFLAKASKEELKQMIETMSAADLAAAVRRLPEKYRANLAEDEIAALACGKSRPSCPRCGNSLMPDSEYCRQCGLMKPLAESDQASATGADLGPRKKLGEALKLRSKYTMKNADVRPSADKSSTAGLTVAMVEGIAKVEGLDLPPIPSRNVFKDDLLKLWAIVKDAEVKTATMSRLKSLSNRFDAYELEHSSAEQEEMTKLPCDLFQAMKVDNHIHLAAAMTPHMLLKFIKDKLKTEPDREVAAGQTLSSLIENAVFPNRAEKAVAELDKFLDVDNLRTVADDHFYHRFDKFNDAYNPLGCGALRTVFLKSSNHIGGAYFGELANLILQSFEENNYHAEMRLSIYGKKPNEWDALAQWLKAHGLHTKEATSRNLWMIQIPRVFGKFRSLEIVESFEELLTNIFKPLFEVALDPASHPDLADVLPYITGIDSVDDESFNDPITARRSQLYGEGMVGSTDEDVLRPGVWTVSENPPYSYYSYYLWANIQRWNDLCRHLGHPWHLTYRPHAGEAGPVHHLATTFLLADGINHGVNLQHSPALQYLYLITQIGISVSPLSNNALFLKVRDNPFPDFFHRGLNVSLSTDDPLMFHSTKEPLLEEFVTAKHVFGLSNADLCEIAANSVRQGSFAPPGQPPGRVLGLSRDWDMDPACSNVPVRRLNFRQKCLAEELHYLQRGPPPPPDMISPKADVDWMKVSDCMA
eukprot:TRINITY_DN103315_c0_g1_i1.p1 TRINITY_DN103315_c0_g1~~TRINITY_DN103315_c0_g1_i1.p1  ORF type:complete len:722 (-),score=118.64 TRINITY_DN103315_c0_g1_i1:41-2164(-)